ncbi:MAG: DUF2723 domain-containing protein [Bacteroidetes Order II. Incertae sedis bacterium]|nr:DUF2723 domain-containing protein [Bacteroidetes Order II. bacterium]
MNARLMHRIAAGFSFLYAFVVYFLTMADTVSFWDCGEFIAIGHGLQVSHPPGAPFYMLIGRLFSMFMPASQIAWSVNLISVLSSAGTALLTYLIVTRMIEEWKGRLEDWEGLDLVAGLGGGLIAALTFTVTDSHWFNSVEAEVYAISMFFTALVVWLTFKWVDQVRRDEQKLGGQLGGVSSRWLLLIAYLFGLATGVHLLNLLAIFFTGLLVYYEKFDKPEFTNGRRFKGILITGLLSSIIFFIIYPGIIQSLPSFAGNSGAPGLVMLVVPFAVAALVYYSHINKKQLLNLFSIGLLLVIIGYSTYALIFIRSAANPPIDENDPETVDAIVSYLKREQYGRTPLLTGASYDNNTGTIDPEKNKLFPRRWSDQSQEHIRFYAQFDSDWDFFWRYQVNHMYIRYFLWNFAGKAGDFQGAPWIAFPDANIEANMQTPSEKKSHNALYGLPLLLGLIGLGWHIKQDWRRAFALGILFFVTGIGIILYLNQTPMQPRERDYAYVASFWAFAFWIGIGATGLIELAGQALRNFASSAKTGVAGAILAVCFVAVPGHMLMENYADHNRKGERVAWDYAWNMLNSLEKDAIIFTNGDNDTFPLWYLQEVEGVRRDVRVVNLSLLQTPWYIRQLKNQKSHHAAPLPISMTDAAIDAIDIQPIEGGGQKVSLPVNPSLFQSGGVFYHAMADSLQAPAKMEWTVKGHPYSEEISLLYPNDQAVLDVIKTNAEQGWKRPIYFAVTVAPDGLVNLEDYLQLEGLATRVVPIQHNESQGRVVPDVMLRRTAQFRFTGLNDPNIYFDENIRGMTDNYRTLFLQLADQLIRSGKTAEAKQVVERLAKQVDPKVIPPDFYSTYLFSETYRKLGETKRADEMMHTAENMAIRQYKTGTDVERAQLYAEQIWRTYMIGGQFDKAAQYGQRLMRELGLQNEEYRMDAKQLKDLFEESKRYQEEQERATDDTLRSLPDTLQQ